jgi:hypothetical protein
MLTHQGGTFSCFSAIHPTGERKTGRLGWAPRFLDEHSSAVPSLSWILTAANLLELAGTNHEGIVHCSEVDLDASPLQVRTASAPGNLVGCQAACLVRPGLVVGVMPDRIVWFRATFPMLKVERALEANFRGVVTCFPSPRTDEVLLVFHDGEIAHVPVGL